jgi:hypothetical protein
MTEEKKYIYKDIEYTLRNKNFKKYVVPSIKFSRKYEDFRKINIPADLEKSVKNIFINRDLIKNSQNIIAENKDKDLKELEVIVAQDTINKIQDEQLADMITYNQLKEEIDKEFLNDENNAKELCEIMFENSESINHNPEGGRKEYGEYYNFIKGVFSDFFSKGNKRLNIF